MKINFRIIASMVSIIILNPFTEFDKTFLEEVAIEQNTNTAWGLEKQNLFLKKCLTSDYKKIDQGFPNRKEFCSCLLDEMIYMMSEKQFSNEMSHISKKSKITPGFINTILDNSMYCTMSFVDELLLNKKITTEFSDLFMIDKNQKVSSEKQLEDPKKTPINDLDEKKSKKSNEKKSKKSFESKVEDYKKIEGLFTFYTKDEDGSVLMEIMPNQLEKIFLKSITRQSGDAAYFDGSSMQGEYPFMLKKIGKNIQLIEVNVKFRADKNLPINKALENHISHSILSNTKIISEPNKKTGAYLIDASNFFITDIGNIGNISFLKYKFDKSNSYFNYIKSFPNNSEIDVSIHYKSNKSNYRFTLADSKSMLHKYHISITEIPESNYIPRIADDRVGHFMTIYQDYSDTYKDSPYVRYINRWKLEKKNPHLNFSEPKEPIVYWIENTVPYEFRDAVKEGILKWNLAFEKIGFKNAIVAKQMPDDADWDPADTRYNTIRWMVQPGNAYAVGPSRANPFTGELYDADIRIGSDFLRFYYTDFVEYIDPLDLITFEDSIHHNHDMCQYQNIMNHKMTYAWNYFTTTGQIENNEKNMKKFVYDGLVDLILHEVGHTLGLRHNFKASSIFSLEELSNPDFTDLYGVTGSVMDYNATNLFDGGKNYFQTFPGHYDYWAIEYAYAEQPPFSKTTEKDFLEKIASKSTEPLLAYGTDEDAGGKGIDPYINRRDMTSNPIKHYAKRIDLGNEYIHSLLDNFEKEGERYPKIRELFYQGFYEYYRGVASVSKFIGGIKHSRHHIGQKYSDSPLKIIDFQTQEEALNFYKDYVFDKNAFQFDPELLNKMAPERLSDLEGDMWRMSRLDFPLHSVVKGVQKLALRRLFDSRIHNRLIDNKMKTDSDAIFELNYLFSELSNSIWEELNFKENINSFRRQLQIMHIDYLVLVYEDSANKYPDDSKSLARLHLGKISSDIQIVLNTSEGLNDYTKAHLLKTLDAINEILDNE